MHIETRHNGEQRSFWLCPHCAQKLGLLSASPVEGADFTDWPQAFQQFYSFLGQSPYAASGPRRQAAACPHCGLRLEEFRRTGLLGCPHCYRHFHTALEPRIRKIQAGLKHQGHRPTRPAETGPGENQQVILTEGQGSSGTSERAQELDLEATRKRLKAEQQEAVQQEDYERAAQLRDQLRALEERG